MGFAQHQSFHIRDGWLRKGMVEVRLNEAIFTDSNQAAFQLGLGKNMAEALRFWMWATGLTDEQPRPTDRKRVQNLTPFGQLVLDHDPYLEEDGTLWLIHYNLISNEEGATAWYWFFNHFARLSFSAAEFVRELELWNIARGAKDIALSSFEKDFDCLVRTYCAREVDTTPEDTLESPLVQLGLLTVGGQDKDEKRYILLRPEPARVPSLVALYVMKRWQEKNNPNSMQVSFRDMLSTPCSPGRTFLLGMRLAEAIRRIEEEEPDLRVQFTRTSGLDVLTLPRDSSTDILRMYYARVGMSVV